MSKRAEAAALKAYPPTHTTVKRHAKRVQSELVDTHKQVRAIFQHGYEQAEKDLAMTGEDIQAIIYIFFLVSREEQFQGTEPPYFCEEVLRRFNEQRKK